MLKAGSLPAPTRIVEEAIVGPSLGQVAQNQGFISMACGLGIVVLFMVAYYSKGGWVANIALVFNIFFILGILAQLNAALTLPGIAGIVLTMGMAVDANVLIYERIKEEMRMGRKLRDAINKGDRAGCGTLHYHRQGCRGYRDHPPFDSPSAGTCGQAIIPGCAGDHRPCHRKRFLLRFLLPSPFHARRSSGYREAYGRVVQTGYACDT